MLWRSLAATAAATALLAWQVFIAAERYSARRRRARTTVYQANTADPPEESTLRSWTLGTDEATRFSSDVLTPEPCQSQSLGETRLVEAVEVDQLESQTIASYAATPAGVPAAGPSCALNAPERLEETQTTPSPANLQTCQAAVHSTSTTLADRDTLLGAEQKSGSATDGTALVHDEDSGGALAEGTESVGDVEGLASTVPSLSGLLSSLQAPREAEDFTFAVVSHHPPVQPSSGLSPFTPAAPLDALLSTQAGGDVDSTACNGFQAKETQDDNQGRPSQPAAAVDEVVMQADANRKAKKGLKGAATGSILDDFERKLAERKKSDNGEVPQPSINQKREGALAQHSLGEQLQHSYSVDTGTLASSRSPGGRTPQQLKNELLSTIRRVTTSPAQADTVSSSDAFLESLLYQPGPSRITKHGFLITETPPSSSEDLQPAPVADNLAIHMEVIAGPVAGKVFSSTGISQELKIGRNPDCEFSIPDNEVSGRHAVIKWSETDSCWSLLDVGSLNGTILNGKVVSKENRQVGEQQCLSDQDLLEFGSVTKVKVRCPTASSRRAVPTLAEPANQHSLNTTRHHGAHPALPIPSLHSFSQLRLEMAVSQKVGFEHLRRNSPSEDVAHWECPFSPFPQGGLFCVFDGHQGAAASTAATQVIPAHLRQQFGSSLSLFDGCSSEEQRELIKRAFIASDAELSMDEGCTATVILVELDSCGNTLLRAANVGDSEAVVVNLTRDEVVVLTEDHRIAANEREQERLRNLGHVVKTRLYGLNISRMLGDRFLKDEDLGFTPEPYVSPIVRFGPDEHCVVLLASDGLWDGLTHERAKSIIESLHSDGALSAESLVNHLMGLVLQQRLKDDVTVMVLNFNTS